jgi:hypothetical protein
VKPAARDGSGSGALCPRRDDVIATDSGVLRGVPAAWPQASRAVAEAWGHFVGPSGSGAHDCSQDETEDAGDALPPSEGQ